MSSNLAYLSLGSNLGDLEGNLAAAAQRIAALPETVLLARSGLYRTAPVGYLEQDWFLNAVLKISTGLAPLELLAATQNIENELGRQRTIHWGPRTMDIDILLYNQEIIDLPRLRVPHPEMANRLFVLTPLAEIEPALSITGLGPVEKILARQPAGQEIFLVREHDQW